MAERRVGRTPQRGRDGRTVAQIALDLAKRHPELTARQIGDLVNKEIDGYVTHTYIQRILQEARQAGMLPPSPRPGPHTRWGYIGRPIPG